MDDVSERAAHAAATAQPPDGPPAGGIGQRLVQAREVLRFAVDKARALRLTEVAASLTFSSVLALVPLAAVVLAVLTAFPIFAEFRDNLERELPRSLLPVPYAQTILHYLTEFASKAAGVGVAGLAFVGLSALSMILTVDRVLNDIWQVHRRRSLAQRLLVYWAVLSVGPLLLGVSLSLSSFVLSASETRWQDWGAGVRQAVAVLAPLLAAVAYSVVYALVPYRRVAWRHAFIGGVVTALTAEGMSRAFAAYVLHGSLLSIYGAFAAVPIFLMWIYLSWLTFLFGAAIAATLPQLRRTRFADARRAGDRAVTALALLKVLFDARGRGDGALAALSLEAMAARLRTDEELLAELLGELEALGYVRKLAAAVARTGQPAAADHDASDPSRMEWVLSCDPRTQGLGAAFHAFAIDPANSLLRRPDLGLGPWLAPVLGGPWLERGLTQAGAPDGETAR